MDIFVYMFVGALIGYGVSAYWHKIELETEKTVAYKRGYREGAINAEKILTRGGD